MQASELPGKLTTTLEELLPPELVLLILRFLAPDCTRRVCKHWAELVRANCTALVNCCLLDHGCDRTIAPQFCDQPARRDFEHIISFLFRVALPNFEFTQGAKFEDEVPLIFRALRYPVNVRKASLQTVGAQHSWPPLLAALAWLTELINYSEAAKAAEENCTDDDQDGFKIFFDYLSRGYGLFLSASDEQLESGAYMSQLEEEIRLKFNSKNASLRQEIESLTQANEDLHRQHGELTNAVSVRAQRRGPSRQRLMWVSK